MDAAEMPAPETTKCVEVSVDVSGIDFRVMASLAFVREVVPRHREDFGKIIRGGEPGFAIRNGMFEDMDAEVYYDMIREYRPKRIIEVGCGNSTLLARRAIADGKLECRLTAIDPEPRKSLGDIEWVREKVETAPLALFKELEENDVLFVDSSHKLEPGNDVARLFTEIIPQVAPGVLVHVHDVFLPYEYPKTFPWSVATEQYVLHAFLSFNREFEVLWAGALMWEKYREVMKQEFGSCGILPGSLWMRRVVHA